AIHEGNSHAVPVALLVPLADDVNDLHLFLAHDSQSFSVCSTLGCFEGPGLRGACRTRFGEVRAEFAPNVREPALATHGDRQVCAAIAPAKSNIFPRERGMTHRGHVSNLEWRAVT